MGNELAVKTTREQVTNIINRMQGQFAKALQGAIPADRFCRVVLTAINKNQALAEALCDPRNQVSVISAFMKCAEMRLEPDGRRATINCYKKGNTGTYDITLIPMYQGLAELVMRSGLISSIHADKVCDNDDFTWDTGEIHHKIDYRKPRGKAYAYYCIVRFKDGAVKTETMSLEEINMIRDRSSAYQGSKKYGKTCPWMTDFDEMAKKTVFRRCSKWLPLSPEQRDALEADDDDYTATAAAIKHSADDQFAKAAGIIDVTDSVTETEEPKAEEVKTAGNEEGLFGEAKA